MKIIELNDRTYPGVLYEAVRAVKSGGVLVFPTDTIYGIGGNALDLNAVKRISRIKKRSQGKPLVLLVKDIPMARQFAYIDLWTESLLEKIWPGPVSVVLHKKDSIPDEVTGGLETVALRLPKFRFISDLLRQVEVPLVATSANRSGEAVDARSLEDFLNYLKESKTKPDLVIDAGKLPSNEPSTILDLTNRKHPVILRKGVMTKAELEKLLIAS